MDQARIAELLQPFVADGRLSSEILEQLRRYLDLLLRWNARMSLTAVRDPEQIVTRHFGESLFAAQVLTRDANASALEPPAVPQTLADLGSGAGFPGIPIKLYAPRLGAHADRVAKRRKPHSSARSCGRATGERRRRFCGRAEQWGKTADVITLRAVEQFERICRWRRSWSRPAEDCACSSAPRKSTRPANSQATTGRGPIQQLFPSALVAS